MDDQRGQSTAKAGRVAPGERKRAVRACDGCRRLKEKCCGGVPCRRCVRLRRQCEFSLTGPVSRAGSSSRTGQDASEQARRLAYMERLLVHYAGDIDLDSENLRGLAEAVECDRATGIGVPPSSRPPEPSSGGSEYLGVDEESFTVQPLENNMTHYSGEFSHWNFSMRIKQWIEHCAPGANGKGETGTLRVKDYWRAEELQSSSSTMTALSSLPPRYVSDFLVNAFFKHAETNYFYVEKTWLMAKINDAYERPASMSSRDVGTVCMIFIVLAIGTQYAYLDSLARLDDDSLGPLSVTEASPFSEDAVGVMFYQQATRLIPDVITVASLECVQACLLIGVYALPLDASGLSYIYLNLAVKLAIQNGMHRKYPSGGLDPVVRETRNRVWWTAYTTEKRVGTFHGRPLSIASADVDADLPLHRPDLWPSSSLSHTAHMLATLHLHQVLGKIAHEISLLRTKARHEMTEGLGRLVDLQGELQKWWLGLPDDEFCKNPTTQSVIYRADMHLKLEYCLVRMFAGRAFIFPRDSARSSGGASRHSSLPSESATGTLPQSHPTPSGRAHPRAALVADCVEAAMSVIETCGVLQRSIGLARASYTEFSACRAALLVITTQCLQRRTDRSRQALRDGTTMLKEMSAGGESARSELSLIEAFERAIARLDAASAGAVPGEDGPDLDDPGAAPASDYARFKKWESLWKTDEAARQLGGEPSPEVPLPIPPGHYPSDMAMEAETTGPHQGIGTGIGGGAGPNVPGATPFFAMDGSFASFPQSMDEFSNMFGYGFGPSPDGGGGPGNDGVWMGP